MMKSISIIGLLVLMCVFSGFTEGDRAYIRSIKKHRKQVHKAFKNPETSPFKDKADTYTHLEYFSPNPIYRVKAKLILTPEATPFQIQTSNPSRQKQFVSYGKLEFQLQGQSYALTVYKNLELTGMAVYEKHLFLLFTDLTSGRDTYGGGRYLDLEVPEAGDELIVDFNLCYNPYCAYGDGWSCPIPPEENDLNCRIEAGVKAYHD